MGFARAPNLAHSSTRNISIAQWQVLRTKASPPPPEKERMRVAGVSHRLKSRLERLLNRIVLVAMKGG